MTELEGVFAPVTTPFDPHTGDADLVALRRNLRWYDASDLGGVVLFGSTGEGVLVEEAERGPLIAGSREVIGAGKLLIVTTPAESTRAAVRLVQHSAAHGADMALVPPPRYYRPAMTAEALRDHYLAVADSSPIPVLLYRVPPAFASTDLAAGLIGELSKHPRIAGMKDSSGDLKFLGTVLSAVRPGFRTLVGDGRLVYAGLELGASGAVAAAANLAPALCAELFARWRRGDPAGAGRLQERIGPLEGEIAGKLGVAGVKAAVDLVGLVGGRPRPPLKPLREKDRARVVAALERAGVKPATDSST
jgi:4-hydroxy-2-oxoglutarate aldolase